MDLSTTQSNNTRNENNFIESNDDMETETGLGHNNTTNHNIKNIANPLNVLQQEHEQQNQNKISVLTPVSSTEVATNGASGINISSDGNHFSFQNWILPSNQLTNSNMNNHCNNILYNAQQINRDQQRNDSPALPSPSFRSQLNPSTLTLSSSSILRRTSPNSILTILSNSMSYNEMNNSDHYEHVKDMPWLDDDDRLPSEAQILDGRYLILSQILGSSFYNCLDIRTGEQLYCKPIDKDPTKILTAYFRMKGQPCIKPLHVLLQTSNRLFLILPSSKYGDLHSYVREHRRLRESEARNLFRQICTTVSLCHEQGIVLRDLKLRKFVFCDAERTQLKFESLEDAVVLDDPNQDILKEKIGCPAYVAPEILKPNSDFSGKAADLWSLGVILYTMLVGRYPFNDPMHSSLFAKIARCQFTIPDYLSSKAKCLIKSLLQKVPKQRLTSSDVLYHPWLQEDNINLFPFANNSAFLNSYYNNNVNENLRNSNDDQCVPELDLDCLNSI